MVADPGDVVGAAEEVAVSAVLRPGRRPRGVRPRPYERRVGGGQADPSTQEDGAHADGGAVGVRSVLPAHQPPQRHEEVGPRQGVEQLGLAQTAMLGVHLIWVNMENFTDEAVHT